MRVRAIAFYESPIERLPMASLPILAEGRASRNSKSSFSTVTSVLLETTCEPLKFHLIHVRCSPARQSYNSLPLCQFPNPYSPIPAPHCYSRPAHDASRSAPSRILVASFFQKKSRRTAPICSLLLFHACACIVPARRVVGAHVTINS